ncbi:hypothetical protein ACGFYQ_12890 [Streptomyces sp. NPDC048258]|uniref:hypothetical protein n=1 Tax=Streptomyces sp. NPDC048258 TaxID=3365527 RepID=UPI003716B55D
MSVNSMQFEQVFTYAWERERGEGGSCVLSVAYEPAEAGRPRGWLLLAGLPDFTELLTFDDAAHAREFARAVLELPQAAESYEREVQLGETSTRTLLSGPVTEERFATLSVGRDPTDELRAYFAYQSYFSFPGRPGLSALGLQVVCEDVDVARAHAEARSLLAALDEGPA